MPVVSAFRTSLHLVFVCVFLCFVAFHVAILPSAFSNANAWRGVGAFEPWVDDIPVRTFERHGHWARLRSKEKNARCSEACLIGMLSPTLGQDLVQSIVIHNVSQDLGVQALQLLADPLGVSPTH